MVGFLRGRGEGWGRCNIMFIRPASSMFSISVQGFFHHYIISGEGIGFRLFQATGLAFAIRILYAGEVIGFRLFRATGLAFAIRPKDGVARQGRRGGFHCYCSKGYWNNVSIMVRVRGRATWLVFAIRPKDGVARQGRRGGFHYYNLV